MKASDLIAEWESVVPLNGETCDTIKIGDPDREVRRVAVTMIATADMLRQAREWGADFLLVHEPCLFDHFDRCGDDPVSQAKAALMRDADLVIYRYHDHPHHCLPDLITEGELHFLGLEGQLEPTEEAACYRFTPATPLTARTLATRMESLLDVQHVRICGAADRETARIAVCFGAPGDGPFRLIHRDDIDMVITGETCEWTLGEYVRDAAALGFNKSLLIMGHVGSERDGMRLMAERLTTAHPELAVRYFDCGEVYTYTDR